MTASMSWELDREHEEFRASVRAFVDRQVRPAVEEPEEAGRPPAVLQPQREQWYSAAQAELLRTARARHGISPDAYWTWVAERQRWMQPWDTVRTGELGDFSYFGGGRMNVADNCVDRWAGLQAVQQAVAAEAAATA